MGEELKRTYTVRIPEQVCAHIEEAARSRCITPTALIQSLVISKFKSRESGDREVDVAAEAAIAARIESIRKNLEQLEQRDAVRFHELRFEIVKTRSALLHSLDQSLGAEVVDKIIEASDKTAREYIAGVNGDTESES